MTYINALRNIAQTHGSAVRANLNTVRETISANWGNINALVFAAILIGCSLTVGCSKEQPQPIRSNVQIPAVESQVAATPTPAPVMQAENKPASRKLVHKKPSTVNYSDKTYGVTFEYSRRYAIETGDAATDVLLSNPVPMNFVQPGGVALAAVELPETGFANTDFSSAFFDVTVNKSLTADQCNEFAVPQPKGSAGTDGQVVDSVHSVSPSAVPEGPSSTSASDSVKSEPANLPATSEAVKADGQSAIAMQAPAGSPAPPSSVEPQGPKLLLGDLDLRGTEAVTGEGLRQSDSKYFHVYQNGNCYEFALNVTTVASQDGLMKHVDRDRVFDRLEKILATVKINPVAAPEVTAETPSTPAAPTAPAQ